MRRRANSTSSAAAVQPCRARTFSISASRTFIVWRRKATIAESTRPGLALLLEGAGRPGHDAAGLFERLGLFLRCGQPDRFQREQFDAVEVADRGVEVMGQSEVDRDQRLGRVRPDPGEFVRFDPAVGAAAADHDVGGGNCARKRVLVQCRAAPGGDEAGGAAGGGIDRDIGAAAFAQQRHGGTGVGAGPEDDGFLGGPVRVFRQVRGEIQGHGDDGEAARTQAPSGRRRPWRSWTRPGTAGPGRSWRCPRAGP